MTNSNSSSLGGTRLPLAIMPTLTIMSILASTLISTAILKESQVSDELNTLNLPEMLARGKSFVCSSSKDVRPILNHQQLSMNDNK